jgi:hypothetical protein
LALRNRKEGKGKRAREPEQESKRGRENVKM